MKTTKNQYGKHCQIHERTQSWGVLAIFCPYHTVLADISLLKMQRRCDELSCFVRWYFYPLVSQAKKRCDNSVSNIMMIDMITTVIIRPATSTRRRWPTLLSASAPSWRNKSRRKTSNVRFFPFAKADTSNTTTFKHFQLLEVPGCQKAMVGAILL